MDFGLIIVGLPRSRTAWLSVFMSQSSTMFHHEAINGCGSIEEYRNKTLRSGDSTGFSFIADEVRAQEKIVIIKKNEKELALHPVGQ